jgi:hypothetical protein
VILCTVISMSPLGLAPGSDIEKMTFTSLLFRISHQ